MKRSVMTDKIGEPSLRYAPFRVLPGRKSPLMHFVYSALSVPTVNLDLSTAKSLKGIDKSVCFCYNGQNFNGRCNSGIKGINPFFTSGLLFPFWDGKIAPTAVEKFTRKPQFYNQIIASIRHRNRYISVRHLFRWNRAKFS